MDSYGSHMTAAAEQLIGSYALLVRSFVERQTVNVVSSGVYRHGSLLAVNISFSTVFGDK